MSMKVRKVGRRDYIPFPTIGGEIKIDYRRLCQMTDLEREWLTWVRSRLPVVVGVAG